MIPNKKQEKKIALLKLKITIGITTSVILITLITGTYLYYSNVKKDDIEQLKQLKSYVTKLKQRTQDFENRMSEIRKYKKSWEQSDEQKKNFNGIKIDEVNTTFNELSEKYNIINPSIKVSVPEALKDGIYDREVSEVILSKVNISFDSLDDIKSIFFIKDFVDSLPGYVIITNLNIKKSREYNNSDFVNINSGKIVGVVSSNLQFSWYVFRRKEKKQK